MSNEHIYGIHPIAEILRSDPGRIKALWTSENNKNPRLQALLQEAKAHQIKIEYVRQDVLRQKIGHEKHQNIVALYHRSPSSLGSVEELLCQPGNSLFLILDGIQDPRNLGACLRAANAFGVTGVIAPRHHGAPLTAVARKVAAGASEWTPYVLVNNLARTLKQLQDNGVWIVGTTLKPALQLCEFNAQGKVALVMGSEDQGIRQLTEKQCDFMVNIPMQGQVQSLNVAVATGVCLYEIQRQRHHHE